MPINPNIALSFQAPQIDDPLNKMAQIEQIKAYRQNALAKEREAQLAERELENMIALRKLYAGGQTPTFEQAYALGGQQGAEIFATQAKAKEAQARQISAERKALMDTVNIGRTSLAATPDDPFAYGQWRQSFVSQYPEMEAFFPSADQYMPAGAQQMGTKRQLLLSADQLAKDESALERLNAQLKSQREIAEENRLAALQRTRETLESQEQRTMASLRSQEDRARLQRELDAEKTKYSRDLKAREIENMNALRKLYAGGESPTLAQSVAAGGKAGLEMFKAQTAAQKEMSLQKKAQQEALMKTVEMGKSRLQSMQDTPEAYSKFYQGFVTEFPEMAPYFADPSTYKPGRGGTKESLLMTAEQLSSDRRSQEQLSSQIAQNLANQINQLSSKIFKVTPEGVQVTDPYALRQYQQLVNRFASFSAMPQGQVGGADAILRAPLDDVTSQNTPPGEGMPGERKTIAEQIATAKAMQAASEKSAQEQVVSAAAKKKNVEMANKLLERIGYDPEKDTTTTDQLIAESTGGGLQKLGADVAGYFNVTTEGMENIGALQTLSTEISKDFLGGNLGSGISNADREFIERMTGDIGNPEIPVDQRRAAFREFVKGLKMIKERGYFLGSPAAPSAPSETVTDGGWSIEVVP